MTNSYLGVLSASAVYFLPYHVLLLMLLWLPACAGVAARGSVAGQAIETRVDSEVARYYLANYLADKREDAVLDERIDRVYRNDHNHLPDRGALKRLSDDFSVDFAALYFAEQIARIPANREIRVAYDRAHAQARKATAESGAHLAAAAANYEMVFVPGYLYKRYRITGADLAAPRAALKRVGLAEHFVETIEDGTVETNAEIVAAAIHARAQRGRRLILVSVSKSGAEVALALTRLGNGGTSSVAAWVNIAGTLQGSPLADESLLQWEDMIGKVDVAGVESLGTVRSRQRFADFRIPRHILVVNYIGVPLTGTVSLLARSGFLQLRAHGPNDGLSLLPDLIVPRGLTLAELGRDHFLVDDQIDAATIALALTVIRRMEHDGRGSSYAPKDGEATPSLETERAISGNP
jgi:hypothetical protein